MGSQTEEELLDLLEKLTNSFYSEIKSLKSYDLELEKKIENALNFIKMRKK